MGNVLYRVCIGTGPRRILVPRCILDLLSSFSSLFEQSPSCISILGVEDKMGSCLVSTIPETRRPRLVKTFGPDEFEKSLEIPTTQIIERHDFRCIIDYLLMKLRTALDRDWLQSLPTLHKVIFPLCDLVRVGKLTRSIISSFSASSNSNIQYAKFHSSSSNYLLIGIRFDNISIRSHDSLSTDST